MSLKSWKAEFYPVGAIQTADQGTVAAAEHSLQKWRGLTKANMRKHDVSVDATNYDWFVLVDHSDDYLRIDTTSCALCQLFFDDTDSDGERCANCPLYVVRGNVSCDNIALKRGETRSPYIAFVGNTKQSSAPMIKWLEKAVKYAKDHAK